MGEYGCGGMGMADGQDRCGSGDQRCKEGREVLGRATRVESGSTSTSGQAEDHTGVRTRSTNGYRPYVAAGKIAPINSIDRSILSLSRLDPRPYLVDFPWLALSSLIRQSIELPSIELKPHSI
jgi:hypothetical protein